VSYTLRVKKALRGAGELEAIDARIEELDKKLDRLRSLYDSFFLGTERTPPNTLRRDCNRQVLELQQVPIGNATMRFRFQSLIQRWVLLTSYWNRTMREIEMGTFRRDLAKAHRHMASKGQALTEEEAVQLGIPLNRVKAFVGRQQRMRQARDVAAAKATTSDGASAAAAPAPPPRAVAGAAAAKDDVPGLAPGELESFYARLAQAHQQTLGAPPKASLEQMRAKLRAELPRLLGPDGGRVTLDFAIENGKVRLKARPVK
jgi:hypothetical protein